MKQINFSHEGGFPLEQESLERLQTAYRFELFGALKAHLSIGTNQNYIVAPATNATKGWVVIQQDESNLNDSETALPITEGILYPVNKGDNSGYLKTTRTGTNLVYGTGVSQTAYYDYEAEYISQAEFLSGISHDSDALKVYYHDLSTFKVVKDLTAIEGILEAINANIDQVESNIDAIEADIDLINQTYLPINGSKAMQGDLDLDIYKLSKLDTKESSVANVRAADFRLGSATRRGLKNPANPLGRALVDSSDAVVTNLHLNYESDWDNTYIGGKVFLNNLNNTTPNGSLLLLDNYNQVIKSDTLIDTLIQRITDLENKPATAVPIGMIAIWGKSAPFPEGWEEYAPLSGRMPVGLYNPDTRQKSEEILYRSYYENLTFYNNNGTMTWPFDTLGAEGGKVAKSLSIDEMPAHDHDLPTDGGGSKNIQSLAGTGNSDEGISETNKTGSRGKSQSFPLMSPYRVVNFIEYTGRPSDTTAPTKPNLSFLNITNSTLSLNWTASNDEFGVTNYLIYKNGIFLGQTLGNVLSFNVSDLTAGTSYNFYVIARDAVGNTSLRSDNGDVTTTAIDTSVPTNIIGRLNGGNEMYVEWNAPIDPGVILYEIWRGPSPHNSSPYTTVTSPFTSLYDTGSFDTVYFYKVRALYNANKYSAFTDEVGIVTDPRVIECFEIESLVTMASGQSKKLKNIVVGDKLQGFSFPNEIDESDGDYMLWNGKLEEATKAEVTVVNKITSIQPNYYEIKTADTIIRATGQHPLLVTQDGENVQWVCIKNVIQSMLLIDKSGKTKAIESIQFKEEPLEVALLDVENVDNYVISGIVAHNNKPLDPQP